MRTRTFATVAALSTVLLAGTGQESVGADGAPADLPSGTLYDPLTKTIRNDGFEIDAALYAESEGIGIEEATVRLRHMERMNDILPRLQASYPEFVALRWEAGRAVAQFKETAPDGALDLLAESGAPVGHELVRYSNAELADLKQAVVTSLEEQGVPSFVVTTDPGSQRIVGTVSSVQGARTLSGASISRQSIYDAMPADVTEADVAIDVVDRQIQQPTAVLGGTDARIGTAFECTIGFSVISGTPNGVATDGHCTDDVNSYRNPFNGDVYVMNFKKLHIGAWGDFMWLTTGGSEVDDFYANEQGQIRDVTSTKPTFSLGEPLIWFGSVSNNNFASTVFDTDVDTSGPKNLVCLAEGGVQRGDSGGPVYWNGVAAGLVWGWVEINNLRRTCLSQTRYIFDAVGASIKQ